MWVHAGEYDDLKDAAVVVITTGVAQKPGQKPSATARPEHHGVQGDRARGYWRPPRKWFS